MFKTAVTCGYMNVLPRVAISFLANVLKALGNFTAGILIARALGPETFGLFSFLLGSFAALNGVLDMGTSSAFFTFISKKKRSKFFFHLYFIWLSVQFITGVGLILWLAPANWIETMWLGTNRNLVAMAFGATFFQGQVWNLISNIGEAQRETAKVQALNISIVCFNLILILALIFIDGLEVPVIFALYICEFSFALVLSFKIFPIAYSANNETTKQILDRYRTFCSPLVISAWVIGILVFLDTWLLQNFGGAVEQAYYSLGFQYSAITLIATASVLRIFWKEISEAQENKDYVKIGKLYRITSVSLYFVGSVIAGLLIFWSSALIEIALDERYSDGAIAMSVMFLYPVHQSLSQLNYTMFYGLQKTKMLVTISLTTHIFGFLVAYFLLASGDAAIPGLGLGSLGLAIKMVCVQIIGANVMTYYLLKTFKWRLNSMYQITGLGTTICVGYLCYELSNLNYWGFISVYGRFLISIFSYCLLLLLLIYFAPKLFGFDKVRIKQIRDKLAALNFR